MRFRLAPIHPPPPIVFFAVSPLFPSFRCSLRIVLFARHIFNDVSRRRCSPDGAAISSGSRFSDKKTNFRGGDSIRREKVRRVVGGRCEKGSGPIPRNPRFRVKDLGFQIKFPLYPSFFLFSFFFFLLSSSLCGDNARTRQITRGREVTRGWKDAWRGRIQIECKFVGERVENVSAWKVKPRRRAKRRKRETLASKVLSRWSNLFSILPFSFSWLGL